MRLMTLIDTYKVKRARGSFRFVCTDFFFNSYYVTEINKGATYMIKNINIYELKMLIGSDDILLLDARDANEYKKKRIQGAINLEVDKVDNILKICPDKNKKIIIYCTKGIRSIAVAERLDELGYKEIYNLEYGIEKILKKSENNT